ncbi:hypothetical protein X975_06506, partial [Stegodyphus mimosarum]
MTFFAGSLDGFVSDIRHTCLYKSFSDYRMQCFCSGSKRKADR